MEPFLEMVQVTPFTQEPEIMAALRDGIVESHKLSVPPTITKAYRWERITWDGGKWWATYTCSISFAPYAKQLQCSPVSLPLDLDYVSKFKVGDEVEYPADILIGPMDEKGFYQRTPDINGRMKEVRIAGVQLERKRDGHVVDYRWGNGGHESVNSFNSERFAYARLKRRA